MLATSGLEERAEILEQLHAKSPRDRKLLLRLVASYLRLADETVERDFLGRALDRAHLLLELDPEAAGTHLALAQVFYRLGVDPLGASHLGLAAEAAPEDSRVPALVEKMRKAGRHDFREVRLSSAGACSFTFYEPAGEGGDSPGRRAMLHAIGTIKGRFDRAYVVRQTSGVAQRRSLLLMTPESIGRTHTWSLEATGPVDLGRVERLIAESERHAPAFRRALEQYAARDLDKREMLSLAAGGFDRILWKARNHHGALEHSALCHYRLSRGATGEEGRLHFDTALDRCRSLLAMDPECATANRTAGLLYFQHACFSRAAEHLRRVPVTDGEGGEDVRAALAWLSMNKQDRFSATGSGSAGATAFDLMSAAADGPAHPDVTTHLLEMVFADGGAYRYTVALTPHFGADGQATYFMELAAPGEDALSLGTFGKEPPSGEEFRDRAIAALKANPGAVAAERPVVGRVIVPDSLVVTSLPSREATLRFLNSHLPEAGKENEKRAKGIWEEKNHVWRYTKGKSGFVIVDDSSGRKTGAFLRASRNGYAIIPIDVYEQTLVPSGVEEELVRDWCRRISERMAFAGSATALAVDGEGKAHKAVFKIDKASPFKLEYEYEELTTVGAELLSDDHFVDEGYDPILRGVEKVTTYKWGGKRSKWIVRPPK